MILKYKNCETVSPAVKKIPEYDEKEIEADLSTNPHENRHKTNLYNPDSHLCLSKSIAEW